jgi:hypothetical protein
MAGQSRPYTSFLIARKDVDARQSGMTVEIRTWMLACSPNTS